MQSSERIELFRRRMQGMRDAYPNCRTAIFVWECYARQQGQGFIKWLRKRGTIEQVIATHKAVASNSPCCERMTEAMREYDTADFRRYLMAVVWGAM